MFDRVQAKTATHSAPLTNQAQPFFSPKPASENDLIQRDGPTEGGETESEGPNALTAGAGVVWSQLNANNPRFSLFMGEQKEIWKNRLWTSQPTEYKVALVSWSLINLGLVGGAMIGDSGFRTDMINLLEETNLLAPLGIIPYAEYFPLNSFQYTLPGDDGQYRFQFGFSLNPYLNLLTAAVPEIPESTLTGSLSTSVGPDGTHVTGGNVSLGTLGGALRINGGTSRGLPMLPTLFDTGDPYALPARHMQSIPGPTNPYSNMQDLRFTISLDLARLFPNVLGGGSPRVQPKLKLGSPNDPLEREADQVADQVVQQKGQPDIQRKCAECEEEEVQMKPKGEGDHGLDTDSEQAIMHAKGTGQKLAPEVQSEMESGIGHGFEQVNIHSDNRSAELNRKMNARAFTQGSDVFFGKGEYQPDTASGKHLLAHELSHVVQQGAAGQVVQRQAAVTPGTRPRVEHRYGLGMRGRYGIYDAELNHDSQTLTLVVRINFNFTGAWPSEAEKTQWTNDFVRLVTNRWSYRFYLLPQGECSDAEMNHVHYGRVRVETGTANPHYNINVQHVTAHAGSSITSSNGTGQLDSMDTVDRTRVHDGVTYVQKGAEHEFGHILGLPHIECDVTTESCPGNYGDEHAERRTTMGSGSIITERDYAPFVGAMYYFSGCNWRASQTLT